MTKNRGSIQRVPAALACALVLGLALVLPNCGGGGSGGSTSPTTPATPPPRVRNVILQSTFSGLEPFDTSDMVWFDPFTTTATGDVDITVDWTFASNDVDVFLARGTVGQAQSPACQEEDRPDCPLELVASTETLSKPETLTILGLPAGSYLVVVANLGTTTESGVVIVGFTT